MNIILFQGGFNMNTQKHLTVTGYSNVSWKDAILKTINELSSSYKNLSNVTILEQSAKITDNKISEYQVTLDLTLIENTDN